MSTRASADVTVAGFALATGDDGLRLDFPTATIGPLAGVAGDTRWTIAATEATQLRARLRTGHWQASSLRARGLALRGPNDAIVVDVGELDLPDGAMIARSPDGIELVAPTAVLRDVRLTSTGGVRAPAAPISVDDPAAAAAPDELRQRRLRFLDAMTGELGLTVKVVLDLPVLGARTLDQTLRVAVAQGAIDFRALDKSLDWLEGTFLDIGLHEERLAVRWGVPIVAPSREILSWALDEEARTLARFDRVPLRSLVDFRVAGGGRGERRSGKLESKPKKHPLRSLTLDDIAVRLALTAPRSVGVGGGHVLFGGDDAPGLVDLRVTGSVGDGNRAGALRGSIGALDLTLSDVALGGAARASIDRVQLGQLDPVEVRFEGFRVVGASATIAEIRAVNLRLLLGRAAAPLADSARR